MPTIFVTQIPVAPRSKTPTGGVFPATRSFGSSKDCASAVWPLAAAAVARLPQIVPSANHDESLARFAMSVTASSAMPREERHGFCEVVADTATRSSTNAARHSRSAAAPPRDRAATRAARSRRGRRADSSM